MNFSCRVENDARRCVRKIGGAIRSSDGFFLRRKNRSFRSMEAYYYRVCVCANKFFPPFFSKFKILLHKSDKRLPNCFNRIDIACLW